MNSQALSISSSQSSSSLLFFTHTSPQAFFVLVLQRLTLTKSPGLCGLVNLSFQYAFAFSCLNFNCGSLGLTFLFSEGLEGLYFSRERTAPIYLFWNAHTWLLEFPPPRFFFSLSSPCCGNAEPKNDQTRLPHQAVYSFPKYLSIIPPSANCKVSRQTNHEGKPKKMRTMKQNFVEENDRYLPYYIVRY